MKTLFSLFVAVVGLCLISATEPYSDGGYAIGDKADDFSLKNIDGEYVSLSEHRDAEGFVVVFTCNTCPYSVLYEDRIIDLNHKLAEKGYKLIAINPNDANMKPGDSYTDMRTRAEEKKFDFPYLVDETQEVFPKFGAKKTPHVFVLDKERIVRYIGAIDDNAREPERVEKNYVLDAVDAIQAGTTPEVEYTKAIGCSIKSRKYNKLKGIKKDKKAALKPIKKKAVIK